MMRESAISPLAISLLGGFHVTWNDAPLTDFESNTVRALLAYLAVEADRPQARTRVAGLFWPDHGESAARTNLRHVLRALRQSLPNLAGVPLLLTTRQTLQLDPEHTPSVDATRFSRLLTECQACRHSALAACIACLTRYVEAAGLYRGEFLAGLAVQNSDLFEEWAVLWRERLHQQALALFATLAAHYETQDDDEQAQHYARRQIELEPWREEAHRQLMRVLAQRGRRTAALMQYEACRTVLMDELGVEPDAETVALYEQIREGELGRPAVSVPAPAAHPPSPAPVQDWGEAPSLTSFYGRQTEMAQLYRWLVEEGCRLIGVLGMGGMGKTSLVVKIAGGLGNRFDLIFWRSLLNAPALPEVLQPLLHLLLPGGEVQIPTTQEEQLALLAGQLPARRCLVVLDNLESILQPGEAGRYRPGYEGYGQLLRRFGHGDHRSCLIFTSRERPHGVEQMEDDLPAVRALQLGGLPPEDGWTLLKMRGLDDEPAQATQLVARYSGNPLALKIVTRTVQELFDGDIRAFLRDETPIFDDIRTVLDEQFARLTPLERELLLWLAVEREAVTLDELAQNLVHAPRRRELIEALRALQRRSLLERSSSGFMLQNVVIEYLTDYLVEQICLEIVDFGASDQVPATLNQFALLKAHAKGVVQESQARTILAPIAKQLVDTLGRTGLASQFTRILSVVRASVSAGRGVRGYTGGNLINLLLHLEMDPTVCDFSQVCVWQAHLRGRFTPGLNLAGADLTGSAFTYIFGFIQGLHYRPDGELLAFGSSEGKIRVWRVADGGLLHTTIMPDPAPSTVLLQGEAYIGILAGVDHRVVVVDVATAHVRYTFAEHRSQVWRIAVDPQGAWFASGDAGGEIFVWEAASGRVLCRLQGAHASIGALAFAPTDGASGLLASGDVRGVIGLWTLPTGQLLRKFQAHPEEVAALQFTPDGTMLASGSHDRSVCLWDVQDMTGSRPRHHLRRHTQPVRVMAVDPTGRLLATGGSDPFAVLWDIESGQAVERLVYNGGARTIVFSADGRYAAVLDKNEAIRVWDVPTARQVDLYRVHHNALHALAISPDGRQLVSGGADWSLYHWNIANPTAAHLLARLEDHQTHVERVAFSEDGVTVASGDQAGEIRIWNMQSGDCRALTGHTGRITGIAFRPGGRQLFSAGADGLLCVWDLEHNARVRVLAGHTNVVSSCAFSPDGRWLASGSMDCTVRLWDADSGQLLRTLQQHTNAVSQVSFSPDGRYLVSSSYDQTYCLWEVNSGALVARRPSPTVYLALAMHPDGKLMAAGGHDFVTRLVEIETGAVIEELQGHSRTVEAVCMTRGEAGGLLLVTAGHDETIRIWEITAAGRAPSICLATLRTPGPYAGMNITGVTGITAAQRESLMALGAVEA